LFKTLASRRTEALRVAYLDSQNQVLAVRTVSVGSLNTTRTAPREILRPAIEANALGFILAHNHPSGSVRPSQDDIDFTRVVKRAGEMMGISLYDHVIIAKQKGRPLSWVSLKEEGHL